MPPADKAAEKGAEATTQATLTANTPYNQTDFTNTFGQPQVPGKPLPAYLDMTGDIYSKSNSHSNCDPTELKQPVHASKEWSEQHHKQANNALTLNDKGQYTVESGDTVYNIAKRELQREGDTAPTGADINKETQKLETLNKDKIQPGKDCGKPPLLKTGISLNLGETPLSPAGESVPPGGDTPPTPVPTATTSGDSPIPNHSAYAHGVDGSPPQQAQDHDSVSTGDQHDSGGHIPRGSDTPPQTQMDVAHAGGEGGAGTDQNVIPGASGAVSVNGPEAPQVAAYGTNEAQAGPVENSAVGAQGDASAAAYAPAPNADVPANTSGQAPKDNQHEGGVIDTIEAGLLKAENWINSLVY